MIQQVVPGLGPEALFRLVMGAEVRVIIQEPLVIAFFVVLVLVPWAAAPFYAQIPANPVALWGSLDAAATRRSSTSPSCTRAGRSWPGVVAGAGIAVVTSSCSQPREPRSTRRPARRTSSWSRSRSG